MSATLSWPSIRPRMWSSWVEDVEDRRRAEFNRKMARIERRQLARDAEPWIDLGGEA